VTTTGNEAAARAPTAVVALGASAGGVDALSELVALLPKDLDASILVVLHISPRGPSVLPAILDRASGMVAQHAVDGEALEAGRIYIAPPDRHLRVQHGVVRLDEGPRENGARPAVDVLFRSVAEGFEDRAIVVVLSGMLDDGTAGAIEVSHRGGTVLVQDPAEAAFPSMPRSAATFGQPDVVAPIAELGPHIVGVVERLAERGERGTVVPEPLNEESQPTEFTCPDCGGTLFADEPSETPHFRCRVGHAYSPASLLLGKDDALEAALWAAIVALEEKADLSRRLYRRLRRTGSDIERYRHQADEAEGRAAAIRDLLANVKRAIVEEDDGPA
jgi:two-component system chemotaxis response regulator CheB